MGNEEVIASVVNTFKKLLSVKSEREGKGVEEGEGENPDEP